MYVKNAADFEEIASLQNFVVPERRGKILFRGKQ